MSNIIKKEELLKKVDDFEDKIELITTLNKEYDSLKSQLKDLMIQIGRENDLEQIKWTTNKGTKITCSIGKPARFEKQKIKEFNELLLKQKYPEIYEECCCEKEREIKVENGSYDSLRITLSKGDTNE